jgi:hypothetical protein
VEAPPISHAPKAATDAPNPAATARNVRRESVCSAMLSPYFSAGREGRYVSASYAFYLQAEEQRCQAQHICA